MKKIKEKLGIAVLFWVAMPGNLLANPNTFTAPDGIVLGEFLNIPPDPPGTFQIMGLNCFRNTNPHLADLELDEEIPEGAEVTFDTRLDQCERDITVKQGTSYATEALDGWVIAEDGWAIESDMKCAEPAKYRVVCQIFDEGSRLPDKNFGDMTAGDVIAINPGILQFMSDGVFTRNVILKVIGD